MLVGVVTLALTWRTRDIAFMPARELRVTQGTWWGFNKEARGEQGKAIG